MATALASWEDVGGATFCSITTVPSVPLCLWKNTTPKVLGKGELLGANPQVSTVLGSPFPVKGQRETRFERLMRGGPAGDFLILDSWKMKVEIEGVCLKEQLHQLPFISFPCLPPISPFPHTPQIPQQS